MTPQDLQKVIYEQFHESTLTCLQLGKTHNAASSKCFACDEGGFSSYSAVFLHLESRACGSGLQVQVINYLVEDRQPWLRAGAPPQTAREADLDRKRNTWKCTLCKKAFLI